MYCNISFNVCIEITFRTRFVVKETSDFKKQMGHGNGNNATIPTCSFSSKLSILVVFAIPWKGRKTKYIFKCNPLKRFTNYNYIVARLEQIYTHILMFLYILKYPLAIKLFVYTRTLYKMQWKSKANKSLNTSFKKAVLESHFIQW